jgi:hypothetical protein
MKSVRELLNLLEDDIDPSKVVADKKDDIDPSKVVIDKKDDIDPSKVVIDKPNSNPPAPNKKTSPKNPNVDALQKELLKINPNGLPKHHNDGIWGPETSALAFSSPEAMEVAKKYADKIPQIKSILASKSFAQDLGKKYSNNTQAQDEKPTDVKRTEVPIEPQADARAQYDKFKADDAKADAQAKLKQMMQVPANPGMGQQSATYINPKTGRLEYFENGSPKGYAYDWMKGGEGQSLTNLAKQAGVEIKNVGGYAQIDPASLTTPAPKPAPAQPDANASSGTGLKMPANFGGGTLGANMGQVNPPQQESVSFQDDELNRIVSLVHHR